MLPKILGTLSEKVPLKRVNENYIIGVYKNPLPHPHWEQCCHPRCDDPLQSFNLENNIK